MDAPPPVNTAGLSAGDIYGQASISPNLPLGADLCRRLSGILIMPELIFGALVWIMIAATNVVYTTQLAHGWILFVSVTLCFISLAQFIIYLLSIPQQTYAWVALDAAYNSMAFLLYFSAAVLQVYLTASIGQIPISFPLDFRMYQLNIAATVFIFIVTSLYGASSFISLKRWKNRQP